MAKTNESEAPVQGTVATIRGNDGKTTDVAELLKQMNEAEVGQELGSDYFTLEPGETARVIALEMTQMNKMGATAGEMVDAVSLIGPDGRQKICADKVIVSAVRGLANKGKLPTPIQIQCTGKTKGQNGTYKEFTINALLLK